MRYLLTPVGSSGDVNPFIGLGRRLRARGHEVVVLTAEPFGDAVRRAGLAFDSTWPAEAYHATTGDPDLWHPTRGLPVILRAAVGGMRDAYDVIARHYVPERTVVVGSALSLATRMFEESRGVPGATLHLQPAILRSRHRGPTIGPGLTLDAAPAWVRRLFWWGADRFIVDPVIEAPLNAWRAELGLGPVTHPFAEWIHSPRCTVGLFPAWFADPQPDWPSQLTLTGFVRYDDPDLGLSDGLERFLDAGEPPLVATAGTANRQAAAFFAAALEAARTLGRRVVLATQYPEQLPSRLPETTFVTAYAPFSLLLPRAAALIHHGGIGTTAQALAAGIPQLAVPISFDQPDNATRMARLGVGRWLRSGRATGRRMAGALAPLLRDAGVTAACIHWRRAIAENDAAERTCDVLEGAGRGTGPT